MAKEAGGTSPSYHPSGSRKAAKAAKGAEQAAEDAEETEVEAEGEVEGEGEASLGDGANGGHASTGSVPWCSQRLERDGGCYGCILRSGHDGALPSYYPCAATAAYCIPAFKARTAPASRP